MQRSSFEIPWKDYDQLEVIRKVRLGHAVSVLMPGGVTIHLNQFVFIPDRVTYEFITEVAKEIESLRDNQVVVEVGVGSGIVVGALAHMFPRIRFAGFDINHRAVMLADENMKDNHIDNCEIIANGSTEWIAHTFTQSIDLIISNPPYVGTEELASKNFHTDYPDAESQPPESILAADPLGIKPYLDIIQEGYRRDVKRWFFRVNSNRREDLLARLAQLFPEITATEKASTVLYLTRR